MRRQRQIFEWVLFATIVFAMILTIVSIVLRVALWMGWFDAS